MADIEIRQNKPTEFRLGLEKDGLGLFPETNSTYEIPFVKGKFQAVLSPAEIQIIEDHFGHKWNDPASRDFWFNVQLPTLKHNKAGLSMDDPLDILLIGVLKYMGVAAPSIEEARNAMGNYKFVIHNKKEEEEMKATVFERKHKAIAELFKIKDSKKHLIALAKYLLPRSTAIGDSKERAYNLLSEFIDGGFGQVSTSLDKFNAALLMDKTELYTIVDFDEAYVKNIIRKNERNMFINGMTGTELGKNKDTAIAFLMDPKNQDEIGTGTAKDQPYSIRAQLKQLNY